MALQGEEKKAYQREYMRRKRGLGLGEKEAVVDTATVETGEVHADDVVAAVRVERPMARTDRLFEDRLPGYYVYQKDAVERSCWRCGEGFKTRLELNKFCSPKCKDGYLDEAFGKMRKS